MRQVVLDTETTGLDPSEGHRIIEIGCLELLDRRASARSFHAYLQPDRDIAEGAVQVHGITAEFLRDKPRFAQVADELLAFIRGAELVIHNAPFDLAFLDAEFARVDPDWAGLTAHCRILDTLDLARELHPGQRNSLDALCRRYGVDNSSRSLHGALLDAEILAAVYLTMTGGQASLSLETARDERRPAPATAGPAEAPRALRVIRASEHELSLHERRLDALEALAGAPCIWRRGQR